MDAEMVGKAFVPAVTKDRIRNTEEDGLFRKSALFLRGRQWRIMIIC
jgi:hypothetical protein